MMNSMMRWITQRLQRTDKDATKDEFRSNDHCSACHASLDAEPQAPMLIDATWGKLATPQEVLCASCILNRALETIPTFMELRAPNLWRMGYRQCERDR